MDPMPQAKAPSNWPVVLPAGGFLILFLATLAFFSIRARLRAAEPPPPGMVWIPGGTFRMGSEDERFPDARPIHEVTVHGFWMDSTEVTNEEFARFVKATGYVTVAERVPDPKQFPTV